jgi:2-dehydropantoate 2-reductase
MKTLIVGPGAMGCLFTALLAEAKQEVWLLDKSPERAEEIARTGIRVEGIGGKRTVPVETTADPEEVGEVGLVFIWVKAYDTASAIRTVGPILTQRTLVVTLQNGLGNVEAIARRAGSDRVIAGATSHGATLLDVGSVRHAGAGRTTIGMASGRRNRDIEQVARLLCGAGLDIEVCEDVEGTIWSKLVVNSAINPLTAITGLRNGQLLESDETQRLLDLVSDESAGIATRCGVSLAYPNPGERAREVCRATAQNRSSMLQDILRGRRTELDSINGALVRKAEGLGAHAPVNGTLTYLVKSLERGDG